MSTHLNRSERISRTNEEGRGRELDSQEIESKSEERCALEVGKGNRSTKQAYPLFKISGLANDQERDQKNQARNR